MALKLKRRTLLQMMAASAAAAASASARLGRALAADDALAKEYRELPFRVRETHEWKLHAADLEAEMRNRGMTFDLIDWSEDQAELPFQE